MNIAPRTHRITLKSVPHGLPRVTDFFLDQIEAPSCAPSRVLVKTLWISVDPYLRGRISGIKTYVDPIHVGSPMVSGCVGVVLESRHRSLVPGDFVSGLWAWQDLATLDADSLQRLDPSIAPVSTALGILGMPGMTAYFGLTEVCKPNPGETVFISGAAGAVGSAVGQIAKNLGCHVVGSAGSAAKVQYLLSIGFDAAFDYHSDWSHSSLLTSHCPRGIDCFFDNVGGELSDTVFSHLNPFARVAICGQISQYNDSSNDMGPRPYTSILVKQLRVEGFIVSRFESQFPIGHARLAAWLNDGKLAYQETVYEGLASAPKAFIDLFEGGNQGKSLVRVATH